MKPENDETSNDAPANEQLDTVRHLRSDPPAMSSTRDTRELSMKAPRIYDRNSATDSSRPRSIPELRRRVSNGDFPLTDNFAMVTTQEMLNPPDTDGLLLQDSDFVSFIEKSVSDDVNTDMLQYL
ncbi:hypothetical protein OSTOST_11571 [Ostertagia ostertagi]